MTKLKLCKLCFITIPREFMVYPTKISLDLVE